MSVAVKKRPLPTTNNQKWVKKKPNYGKKRKRLISSSTRERTFVPGGDETDPLNLKDPDLTLTYTPSPDHKADIPDPEIFVNKSDPLHLKEESPKRKRERKNSRHKSGTSQSESSDTSKDKPSIRFNEKAKKFSYGNYSKYYGYRNPSKQEDVRLTYFDKSWFQGKECLDLGCNIGHITLTIAKDYQPKKIVGVDIDGNLITVARNNIRRYMSKFTSSKFPMSMRVCYGPLFGHDSGDTSFPNNVTFREENWVPYEDEFVVTEKYDVILCLSVTKWVHLNWGDRGIKNLFTKMFRSLRPGGRLILECQNWKGYARRKKLTPRIYENYKNIHIYPNEFPHYLQTMGFEDWKTIGIPEHSQKGFRRPIWMFKKPLAGQGEGLLTSSPEGSTPSPTPATPTPSSALTPSDVGPRMGSPDDVTPEQGVPGTPLSQQEATAVAAVSPDKLTNGHAGPTPSPPSMEENGAGRHGNGHQTSSSEETHSGSAS